MNLLLRNNFGWFGQVLVAIKLVVTEGPVYNEKFHAQKSAGCYKLYF